MSEYYHSPGGSPKGFIDKSLIKEAKILVPNVIRGQLQRGKNARVGDIRHLG